VGIASAARGDDRRTLFAAADGVLYDAKRSGRDRVVRLSGVTHTRAGASPLDSVSAPAEHAAAPTDDHGFAPLLIDPPLGVDRPGEPLLGPLPGPPADEPDVVWGTGRSTEDVLALMRESRREHPDRSTVVLRAAPETLVAVASEHEDATLDAAAMALAVGPVPEPVGRIGIVTAAAGPVAAETAFVARIAGTEAVRIEAGSTKLPDVDCLVVVGADAGTAGALAALTDAPVLAVPTSDGRPGGLAGLGAALGMLGSPAAGVAVGALDDGWSAGVFAARVARRAARR
jgi:NCAIR mutase (PurE)-related protein